MANELSFSVKSDVRAVERYLDKIQKQQLPYVTALAINQTAKRVKSSEQREMPRVFDRPKPFTVQGLVIDFANKRNLTAEVRLREQAHKGTPPVKYLAPNITGGTRRLKGYEVRLLHAGILNQGEYTAPAKGIKLDRYGNLPASRIVKMLSNVRAQFDPQQNTPQRGTERRRGIATGRTQYFVATIGGARGIWERIGKGKRIRLFLAIVGRPTYSKRFKFHEVAQKTAARYFPGEFRSAMDHAIKTARVS